MPCACAVGSTRAWAAELAALSGRHKQLVGRTIDELEALGCVTRAPDPAHRRAKLVVPTSATGR